MTTPINPAVAALMLTGAALCWAGNHVVARAIAQKVPPATVNLFRWLLVAALLGWFARKTIARDWPLLRRSWLSLAALGVAGGGIFGTLQYVGLQHTTIVNMGILNSVAPPLIVLASWLTFRDAIRPIQLVGIAISLLGVLAMASQLSWAVLASLTFNRGDLIIFANMAVFAVYSACLRLRPPVALTTFLFALSIPAALVNVPWAWFEHAGGFVFIPGLLSLGAVLYAAVVNSIIAYLCWSRGIETLGAGRAGVFLHMIPVFNTILGVALFGEQPQLHHGVGLALILTGVVLTTRGAAPAPTRS